MQLEPVQRSCLQVIFNAWHMEIRDMADERARINDIAIQEYDRPRCVLRFMLGSLEFKKAIAPLWKCIDSLTCAPEGRALIQTLYFAVAFMPSLTIKLCSYQGACVRRSTKCTRLKGWPWHDPGNRVYAMFWYLLIRYCKFIKAVTADKNPPVPWCQKRIRFAIYMLDIHTRAMERWPGKKEKRHYERVGDLLEFVLGRCYCDRTGRLDGLTHMMSDIVFWVQTIYHAAWFNQPTQPRNSITARHWADAIYWIHELQRTKKVLCGKDYHYSDDERRFDIWASEVNHCYELHDEM